MVVNTLKIWSKGCHSKIFTVSYWLPLVQPEKLIMGSRQGDLSLAARIGSSVRCIAVPDITFWQVMAPLQAFRRPIPGQLYYLRSHVYPGLNFPSSYACGVLLDEKNPRTGKISPFTNTEVMFQGNAFGEPFFAYTCFIIVSP